MARIRLAISIRQPYAEMILTGAKRFEYRSRKTHVRERVYIYASRARSDEREWRRSGYESGSLPTGVIVGTVEVTDCQVRKYGYAWKLEVPIRAQRKQRPRKQPQPTWFCPFGK